MERQRRSTGSKCTYIRKSESFVLVRESKNTYGEFLENTKRAHQYFCMRSLLRISSSRVELYSCPVNARIYLTLEYHEKNKAVVSRLRLLGWAFKAKSYATS